MKVRFLRLFSLILIAMLLFQAAGCAFVVPSSQDGPGEIILPEISDLPNQTEYAAPTDSPSETQKYQKPERNGSYYDVDHVVLYLYYYGELPSNFITKQEARSLGWEGGSVEKYKKGAAIGGDTFGNREGSLPKANGRKYWECDIDTQGQNSRGAKRLIYSNDGLFFYTNDHYENFTEIQITEEGAILWK